MSTFDPRLLKRVLSGNMLEPSAALDTLIAKGAARDPDVVAAVEARLRDGRFFNQDVLVRWIIAAAPSSTNVFNGQWIHFRRSPSAVLELLRSQSIAARDVERAALDLLDEYGTKPGEPSRPALFDALRDHGSRASLPWLKSLQVDLKAQASLRRDVATAVPDILNPILANALEESFTKCADAIAAIEARAAPSGGEAAGVVAVEPLSVRPTRYALTHLDEARRAASSSSPGACLNPLRMFAEAICDELYGRWNLGPLAPDSLGPKLTALKDQLKSKDRWLQARMWALKFLVDFGSHHTPDFVDRLTAEDVRLAIELAEGIHRSYLSLDS
jgi:hypothetical protein